mmetsp:Transcript_30793/g.68000  ORF Transcript_30793/g.68000 Transcript_30793/m.68000 type:complete len:164 (-) Transcript_30793:23-514(-)
MASQQKQAGAQPEGAVMKSPHLYPAGWGWNSGGRAGHITAEEVREPAMMQRCMPKGESYISCAAGTNHTLLVSDAGQVYALGEGRWGQLGLGNPFTGALRKGGTYQSTPREVTPSGAYKYHADMKISQVGGEGGVCGGGAGAGGGIRGNGHSQESDSQESKKG